MGLRRRCGGRFEPRHVRNHLIVEERRLTDHEQLVPAESFGGFAVRMGAIALDVAERRQTRRRYKVPRAPIPGIEVR